MASYFEEHNCVPLEEGQTPNHALHLARLLLDTGLAAEWETEFSRLLGHGERAPPASKKAVEELESTVVCPTSSAFGKKCSVCLMEFDVDDGIKILPCSHRFHSNCILPWLSKVNSCPLCRHELPTDDPQYEAMKKHKARAKQREFELNTLHDSMFG